MFHHLHPYSADTVSIGLAGMKASKRSALSAVRVARQHKVEVQAATGTISKLKLMAQAKIRALNAKQMQLLQEETSVLSAQATA